MNVRGAVECIDHDRQCDNNEGMLEVFEYAEGSALAHRALQDRAGPQRCMTGRMKSPNVFKPGGDRIEFASTGALRPIGSRRPTTTSPIATPSRTQVS